MFKCVLRDVRVRTVIKMEVEIGDSATGSGFASRAQNMGYTMHCTSFPSHRTLSKTLLT